MSEAKVTIHFEGRTFAVRPDASVAAALWENGVRHLSHSPKYGRPRGMTCARGQCTACLMRVDGIPNVRTCETPVHDGMTIVRQDPGACYGTPMQKTLALGGRFFPVGFYYKWFTKPAVLSRLFLRGIRPLTGIGRLPEPVVGVPALPATAGSAVPSRDLGRFTTVIVGAGLSGLAAAAAAAGPVLLLDENKDIGGLRLAALREIAAAPNLDIDCFAALRDARDRLEAATVPADVQIRTGARVVAGYAPNGLVIRDSAGLATVHCDELIWSAGALDTLGLFPGNDSPGLMGPRALLRLLVRDGLDVAGRSALLIGGGLDLWLSAALLATRGAHLSLVITTDGMQSEIATAVGLGWQLTTGLELSRATVRGPDTIAATFTPGNAAAGMSESHLRMEADLAVVCRRGKPAYDIPYQLGADLQLVPELGGFVPRGIADGRFSDELPGGMRLTVVGEAAGLSPSALLTGTEVET